MICRLALCFLAVSRVSAVEVKVDIIEANAENAPVTTSNRYDSQVSWRSLRV
jgi:hypothetical protein